MALTTRREADVLARLLDGESVPDADARLLELSRIASSIPRTAPAPDPAFVERLRARLLEQAAARGEQRTHTPLATPLARAGAGHPGESAPRELVLRLPRLPRGLMPGLAAGLLGLAVLIGGLSTRALPGDRLYDVKLGIGQAQVRLAGSDLARGRALLGQVDRRLDEVDALVAAGDPRSSQVDLALVQAAADLADAQRVLLAGNGGRSDPEALRALADASAQAQGRLAALGPLVPRASEPQLRRLLDLLRAGQLVLRQQALVCAAACADLSRELDRTLTGLTSTGGSTGTAGASGSPTASPSGSAGPSVVPSAAPTRPPGGGVLPSASTSSRPSVPGVTVTLPGGGVTVPLPSVTTPTGGGLPTITVPPVGATLGPLTATVSTSGCVVNLAGLCVGG